MAAAAVIGAGLGAGSSLHAQCPQALCRSAHQQQLGRTRRAQRVRGRVRAVSELVEASQSVQGAPDLTWQIWVGAIDNPRTVHCYKGKENTEGLCSKCVGCDSAGVTPFVVAGIEFSKRIAAQQRCAVCGGSGLVKKAGSYFRCGNCGGFLPWYSWRRFFKG